MLFTVTFCTGFIVSSIKLNERLLKLTRFCEGGAAGQTLRHARSHVWITPASAPVTWLKRLQTSSFVTFADLLWRRKPCICDTRSFVNKYVSRKLGPWKLKAGVCPRRRHFGCGNGRTNASLLFCVEVFEPLYSRNQVTRGYLSQVRLNICFYRVENKLLTLSITVKTPAFPPASKQRGPS